MAAWPWSARELRLTGIADKVRCPFFCLHGENDTIMQLDFAQRLYNRQVGANIVADWLADNL